MDELKPALGCNPLLTYPPPPLHMHTFLYLQQMLSLPLPLSSSSSSSSLFVLSVVFVFSVFVWLSLMPCPDGQRFVAFADELKATHTHTQKKRLQKSEQKSRGVIVISGSGSGCRGRLSTWGADTALVGDKTATQPPQPPTLPHTDSHVILAGGTHTQHTHTPRHGQAGGKAKAATATTARAIDVPRSSAAQ